VATLTASQEGRISMALSLTRRNSAVFAGVISVAVVAAGCSSGSGSGSSGGASAGGGDCAAYSSYGDLKGKTVSLYTGITAGEYDLLASSWKKFEECTGASIKGQSDKAFEAQILVQAKAGNPPDIGVVPQPGLLAQLVATGKVKEAPAETVANIDKFWTKDYKTFGTVNGKVYAAPLGSNVKSFVWYSPAEFKEKGFSIPKTLDELKALSDKIVSTGKKPWCAGIASGDATGWVVTDWMEDMMLRTVGPDQYDKWVKHEVPFNGPEEVTALDAAGSYLKNPQYVNGGLGDVKSIATTEFADAGLPILQGQCSLHRQASFYAANWPAGTQIAEDGQVYAFYFPSKTATDKPVLVGGEFIAAFADRPEVKAFQAFLASDTWINERLKAAKEAGTTGYVSSNSGLDESLLVSPIDKLSVQILKDKSATTRFDGSDQMPGAVGSNSFWKQGTSWITGQDTKTTLDNIEASWPKS
jgi:alpha-glucoside transport system substrate-binding protein